MDAGVYQNGDISESDVTQVTDPSGNCMKFIGYDGEYLSAEGVRLGQFPDPRINIPQIKEMEVKENDIFINAYPKAGTHWVWEISKMLLKGKAEYEEAIKETAMIEFNSPEMLQKLPPPRVFNSHLYFRNLPRDIIKKKCKIIFVNRNPKDICVSYYHHCVHVIKYKGSFDDFINLFFKDIVYHSSWIRYTLDWENVLRNQTELPVIILNYEDLKQNPVEEINRLAAFLGVNVTENLVEEIADRCSFAKMKTAHTEVKKHDITSMMYRKGEAGGWKNVFTVAQNEMFDAVLAEKMKKCKFEFKYEL